MNNSFLKITFLLLMALPFATTASVQASSEEDLSLRMLERRAVEAVIWGMPLVNYDRMFQAAAKAGATSNQVVYWSAPAQWKNQTLTPNPDTIYVIPFLDTSTVGPMVVEIPPAKGGVVVGSLMDAWQMPLADVGVAGTDQGEGGKYLVLPPGYDGEIPDGYIATPALTYKSYALLRSNFDDTTEANIRKAAEFGKKVKVYPLSEANLQPKTTFVSADDDTFDSNIPYDMRFFESLNRMVQSEPWLTRDKIMINVLGTIGIEKGKPFNPDDATKRILEDAIIEAREWMDAQYEAGYSNTFYPGNHWALPVFPQFLRDAQAGYSSTDDYAWNARGISYTFVFFAPKKLGAAAFYMFEMQDKDGNFLEGRNTYRLRVPANVPVKQYWSLALYDRETHGLIRNMPWPSRASNMPDLKRNDDGTVDVWIGPAAPEGMESNWIPTDAARPFEALFRFYGPLPPLLKKEWVLPDIERVH